MLLYILILLPVIFTLDCDQRFVQSGNKSLDFMTMKEICKRDSFCSSFYHLDDSRYNATVFRHLTHPVYERLGGDLNNVFKSICSGDMDTLFQKLLLLEMNGVRVTSGVLCGHNEIPVVQQDSTISCLCSPESVCSPSQEDLTALWYVIGVVSFILGILLIFRVKENFDLFSFGLKTVTEKKKK